jgi:hypothetical protein
MPELKPDMNALMRAGRTAFRPQASDRDRVRQSLAGTLGESTFLEGSHPPRMTESVVPRFPAPHWVLGGVGALALAAAVVVAAHPSPTAQAVPPVALSIPAAELPSSPPAVPPLSNADDDTRKHSRAEGSMAITAGPAARPIVAHGSSDSLPEEVHLLSKAEQQLNFGHPDQALTTLGEHERRFPHGVLAEERMAARVQSLCALGRVAEARADLTRFARAYPRSPHLEHARTFCGVDAL